MKRQVSWSSPLTQDGAPAKTLPRRALLDVTRFDGIRKSEKCWDSLRRDEELWLHDGNCLVHLYAPGTSRRGPSLKIPLHMIEQSDCPYLFSECIYRPDPPSPSITSDDDNSDSGYGASISDKAPPSRTCELYIPAPAELTRHEAYLYHIGTRNYFAYLLNKPIVGQHLSDALSGLATRIEAWQPTSAGATSFLDYCEGQGYLDFAENIDYAVAGLVLAEQSRITSIWVDAFAHCVGMRERLEEAPEADRLSSTSRALISHASSVMNSHVSRATTAIGSFLEEELSPDYLGLSKAMRDHLDHFRSILQSFYVNEVGYFPPDENDPWDKRLWNGMYEDFRSLYEYLADKESSSDRASSRCLNGGICVAQNLEAFDTRHGYKALPHRLPLEPEMPVQRRGTELQRSLRSFKVGGWPSDAIRQPKLTQTLSRASNHCNPAILQNRLVQEYIRFERARLEKKVSPVEARRVRWLLVYGVLQTLISITKAPAEVQDAETPSYPLCLVETYSPSWSQGQMGHQDEHEPQPRISAEMDAVRRTMEEDRLSIHPDCEAECAEDFFSMNRFSRTSSGTNVGVEDTLVRPSPLLSRTASIRSSVNSLHQSIVGSLSRHSTYSIRRKDSTKLPSRVNSFREGMLKDKLNLNDGVGSQDVSEDSEPPVEHKSVPTLALERLRINKIPEDTTIDAAESPSVRSGYSQTTQSSTSLCLDEPESPMSEISASTADRDSNQDCPSHELPRRNHQNGATLEKPETYQAKTNRDVDQPPGLHAGCYVPTGPDSTVHSRMQSRAMSAESVSSMVSTASSQYPESSQQAAEIEEVETRGRQRLRGLRSIRTFGVVDGEVNVQDNTPFKSWE